MKNVLLATLLGLVVCVEANGQAKTAELWLVKGGQPAATIVIPEDSAYWMTQAAQWLVEYVQKASNAELKIVREAKATPAGNIISIGPTKLAADAGVDDRGLKWDACKLVVKGDVLFLLGRDDAGTKTHNWVGARGTNRAVIKLLEDFCGVRWFLPGPHGELVPKSPDIRLPRKLNQTFTPAFAYSDGRSVYDENILNEPGKSLAAQANNYRKAVKVAPGGHSYYHAVPTEKHFKDHPEYFALMDGKRTGKGNHLCTSHPEVKRLLVEYMRMRFEQGLDWVSLGQEDGYLRCQCDECEKLDDYRFMDWQQGRADKRWETFQNTRLKETPCDRLLMLHKAVADEMATAYPDKKLMLMCYAPTAWPSKKIPHYGENVIAELMNLREDYINAWRDKVGGFTGYVYWFNTTIPMGLNLHMTPDEAADRIRFLHKNGCLALSLDPEGGWGLQGPVYYMMGRMLGDPMQDQTALVEEYCNGVYEDAGPTMLKFFDLLHERLSQVVPITDDDIAADARNTTLPRWMTTQQMYLAMYPPEVLTRLESLIGQAEREAKTERARGWVRLSRDQFDFIKRLTEMLISYQAWQVKPTRDNWLELKSTVDTFETWRDEIVMYSKEHTDAWWPGHDIFCKWIVGNLEDTSVAFYKPWDQRKAEVLEKGLRGRAMGYGTSYYYSFIREPLTLDFGKQP
jgi:hypothetical protein